MEAGWGSRCSSQRRLPPAHRLRFRQRRLGRRSRRQHRHAQRDRNQRETGEPSRRAGRRRPGADGPVVTGVDGTYTVELPVGATPRLHDGGLRRGAATVSILAATTMTRDFALDPANAVQITISGVPSPAHARPVLPSDRDGDAVRRLRPSPATLGAVELRHVDIEDTASATPTIILPRRRRLQGLPRRPRAPAARRWNVLPVNPHLLEETEVVTLLCTVTTTSGEYTAAVDVQAHLDFGAWATGLRNVPTNVPVVMSGKEQGQLRLDHHRRSDRQHGRAPGRRHPGTPGSCPTSRASTPWPSPTRPRAPTRSPCTWATGPAASTAPTTTVPSSTSMCVGCHAGSTDWNEAYDCWRRSGHAHIFTTQINDGWPLQRRLLRLPHGRFRHDGRQRRHRRPDATTTTSTPPCGPAVT